MAKVHVEIERVERGSFRIVADMDALMKRMIEQVIDRAQDGDADAVRWLGEIDLFHWKVNK